MSFTLWGSKENLKLCFLKLFDAQNTMQQLLGMVPLVFSNMAPHLLIGGVVILMDGDVTNGRSHECNPAVTNIHPNLQVNAAL